MDRDVVYASVIRKLRALEGGMGTSAGMKTAGHTGYPLLQLYLAADNGEHGDSLYKEAFPKIPKKAPAPKPTARPPRKPTPPKAPPPSRVEKVQVTGGERPWGGLKKEYTGPGRFGRHQLESMEPAEFNRLAKDFDGRLSQVQRQLRASKRAAIPDAGREALIREEASLRQQLREMGIYRDSVRLTRPDFYTQTAIAQGAIGRVRADVVSGYPTQIPASAESMESRIQALRTSRDGWRDAYSRAKPESTEAIVTANQFHQADKELAKLEGIYRADISLPDSRRLWDSLAPTPTSIASVVPARTRIDSLEQQLAHVRRLETEVAKTRSHHTQFELDIARRELEASERFQRARLETGKVGAAEYEALRGALTTPAESAAITAGRTAAETEARAESVRRQMADAPDGPRRSRLDTKAQRLHEQAVRESEFAARQREYVVARRTFEDAERTLNAIPEANRVLDDVAYASAVAAQQDALSAYARAANEVTAARSAIPSGSRMFGSSYVSAEQAAHLNRTNIEGMYNSARFGSGETSLDDAIANSFGGKGTPGYQRFRQNFEAYAEHPTTGNLNQVLNRSGLDFTLGQAVADATQRGREGMYRSTVGTAVLQCLVRLASRTGNRRWSG